MAAAKIPHAIASILREHEQLSPQPPQPPTHAPLVEMSRQSGTSGDAALMRGRCLFSIGLCGDHVTRAYFRVYKHAGVSGWRLAW